MRKIKNPWRDLEGFKCFGCSENNPNGLQMEFFEDNNEIICFWQPKDFFQGWIDTIHGGIICSLMDELAAWVVIYETKTSGVTSKMDVKFLKKISTNEPTIIIKGKLNRMMKNIAVVDTWIENNNGEICSKAEIYYFTYPREIAIDQYSHKDFEFE